MLDPAIVKTRSESPNKRRESPDKNKVLREHSLTINREVAFYP